MLDAMLAIVLIARRIVRLVCLLIGFAVWNVTNKLLLEPETIHLTKGISDFTEDVFIYVYGSLKVKFS